MPRFCIRQGSEYATVLNMPGLGIHQVSQYTKFVNMLTEKYSHGFFLSNNPRPQVDSKDTERILIQKSQTLQKRAQTKFSSKFYRNSHI